MQNWLNVQGLSFYRIALHGSWRPGLWQEHRLAIAGRAFEEVALPDVTVGAINHLQSNLADFYRELGDIFCVSMRPSNRWGGFKALRERWLTCEGNPAPCGTRTLTMKKKHR